jgi:hypothetical protein
LLTATNRRIRDAKIGSPEFWWPDGQVRAAVARQFERKGRLMLFAASRYPAPFLYGIVPDVNGEAQVAAWVEVDPKKTSVRHSLLAWYNANAPLLPSWTLNREDRHFKGWPVLVAFESPINLPTEERARDFIVSRLQELGAAGYFELLPTLGAQPAPAPLDGSQTDGNPP